jgi:hypothetical protein
MVDDEDMGGDPVCWAHLFCQECGVLLDGTAHGANCSCVDWKRDAPSASIW